MSQTSDVPMLPQLRHSRAVSPTMRIASARGSMTRPRFLIRCSTARRAERGPSPGSLAINSIRASMSFVASDKSGSERKLHVGGQAEAFGQLGHLFLALVGGLHLGVLDGGEDQVF